MESQNNGKENPLFIRLNKLLDQHLDDPDFSLEKLYKTLGVSRSQLVRLVKEQVGVSLSYYIRLHRLEKARELLRTTDWRIVEITERVGLDSPQTLARYFAQEFGTTPSEYRKSILVEEKLPHPEPLVPVAAEEQEDAGPPAEQGTYLPSPAVSRFKIRRRGLVISGVVLIVVAALFLRFFQPVLLDGTGSSEAGNSVAILPFTNRGTPEDDLLADGLMGQVHASLVSIKNLKVISRTSTGLFKNTKKTIPQIGSELGVRYLLVGEVIPLSDRMRVRVELVEAAGNRSVWTHTYEGGTKEMISTMNAVARQVTVVLDHTLNASESRRINRIPTENEEAYREYLLGKQLMISRTTVKLSASIERFDRALALAPDFADALAYKALACFIRGETAVNRRESVRLAEQLALKAIRLDGENGLAYATLANCYRVLNKWEQAVTTYQIALQYSPNEAQILYWYSITLRSLGQFDEAIQYSTRALALDPLYPTILAGHIGNLSYAGRYDEAERLFKDYELALNDSPLYYYVRGYYYLNRGDYTHALPQFSKTIALNPNDQSVLPVIQFCHARLGQADSVKSYLASLPDTPEYNTARTIAYAGLKDRERCLHHLRLGAEQGLTADYIRVSPLFRFLHGDPRFEDILRKLGLMGNPV